MSWELIFEKVWQESLATLYMVGVSTLFTVLLGLPLGILLVATDERGVHPRPVLNRILDVVVNVGRSIPFIILMILIIPFTRLIAGTSIGSSAAIVPLTVAAIPFFARVAENSLREVDRGLIEAAQSIGCSKKEIITKVLIPEALPSLILGVALTFISLVGYSAMAGAIGGGGLGDLAIRYGYQRYETEIMLVTVVVLVVLVQGVQALGNWLAGRVNRR